MSGRKGEVSEPMAELLRSLTASAPGGPAIDSVQRDFKVPAKQAAMVHAVLPFSGTVPASLPPSEVRALTR